MAKQRGFPGLKGGQKRTRAQGLTIINNGVGGSASTDDQNAAEVPFTPDGDITATNVQTAVVEVRDDADTKLALKAPLASPSFTGTVTSAGLIDISGAAAGQVKFPATQNASADANTLDDYEEGIWTMGLEFGGAAVGMTSTFNTGWYTKVGNKVTVGGYILLTAKGSSTGTATIAGLPYNVKTGATYYAANSVYCSVVSYLGMITSYASQNSDTLALFDLTEAGSPGSLDNTNFGDTSEIIIGCTYLV